MAEVRRPFVDTADRVGRGDSQEGYPDLVGRELESEVLRRVEEVEAALQRLSQTEAVLAVERIGRGTGSRPQPAAILFFDLPEEPDPSTLEGPAETLTESGARVETTYMRVPLPAGQRVVRVERTPSEGAEWFPVAGWNQDGDDLRLIYRRVTRYPSATDTEGIGLGLLRIWVVSSG